MTDVKFPDGLVVAGEHPLIIIGPNGVGKTRLGVRVAQENEGQRVAALRNVEIPAIPLSRYADANREVQNALREVMTSHWRQSFELQQLLAEILAEDRENAVAFREHSINNPTEQPDKKLSETRLRKIVSLWNKHFPNRTIKIDYEPKVARFVDGNEETYEIARMSEGERTALYLIARIVSCKSPILVVDEPETFFHPLLARNLWDDLEDTAKDIRLVYITHDIPFALSRRAGQFAIARSAVKAELLPSASTLPAELVAQIFGAASFSVTASRLVFCEGADSYDHEILSAWHNSPNTAVVAAGGCQQVRECVAVFRSGRVTGGLEAFGYVDRDGLPDDVLTADQFVKPQSVYEIEGVICIEAVFKALGVYHGLDETEVAARYRTFLERARAEFQGVLFNKEILNRAKKRAELLLIALMNPVKPDPDLNKVRAGFETAAPPDGWQASFQTIFGEEEARLTNSLAGHAEILLRDFPSKSYYGHAANLLEMKAEVLVRTVCQALKLSEQEASENKKLAALRDSLVATLSPILWPR